jgi:bifunctional DNA-binding transcriptional regulator/antitoxin component of YhaV-PrlF toxin-antitoxin module
MVVLSVTSRGQVTFRKEVLQHLGIEPGGKIHIDLLPDGRAELRADAPKGAIADLRGLLRGKTNGRTLSLDDINDAIAEAGARAGKGDR